MWGTFLSEPLRIVGLVGRYPANYLMRRMPIPYRNSFSPKRCLYGVYAVLDGVSADYSPVGGRLHTCYSPVRRSPADKSKLSSPLPLDLHVLSLSLAFILSQDQTLRCLSIFSFFLLIQKEQGKIDNQVFLFVVCCSPAAIRRDGLPTAASSAVRASCFSESTKSLLFFSSGRPER